MCMENNDYNLELARYIRSIIKNTKMKKGI